MPEFNSSEKIANVDPYRAKSSSGFVGIARKLGIAVPTGLLLLANMSVNAAFDAQGSLAEMKGPCNRSKLSSNEVATQLLDYAEQGVKIASAADCKGIHSDTHVNKDYPEHWDKHGDSCRY